MFSEIMISVLQLPAQLFQNFLKCVTGIAQQRQTTRAVHANRFM